MELRLLTGEDRNAHNRLMEEAFAQGNRSAPDPTPELPQGYASRSWGLWDGSRLIAAATIHPLPVTWGDHDVVMGGIAGVACTADQRGRGHVARLLRESLLDMRAQGQYLSGLYPFAYAFYHKHGWDWVGERRSYRAPIAAISASPEGRSVRCYDGPDALEIVKPVYAAFAQRYRGMSTREHAYPNFWGPLDHSDNRTTYVQVYHDPVTDIPEGYLAFRYPHGGDSAFCREFVANTPAAYRGLLSVLHYYGTQVREVGFDAPADDALPLFVMHNDLQTRVSSVFMGRVVDVAPALTALTSPEKLTGQVVMRVSDPHCDWNDQTFAVSMEDGHVTVAASDAEAGVTLDIQAFSQAYWGQPSLHLLRSAGRITVTDEAQYQLLTALLPPTLCFFNNHF